LLARLGLGWVVGAAALAVATPIFGQAVQITPVAPAPDEKSDEDGLKAAGITPDADGITEFLKGLRPTSQTAETIARLVADLGDKDWAVREQATKKLTGLSDAARLMSSRAANRPVKALTLTPPR
jgi:hypothetical protein